MQAKKGTGFDVQMAASGHAAMAREGAMLQWQERGPCCNGKRGGHAAMARVAKRGSHAAMARVAKRGGHAAMARAAKRGGHAAMARAAKRGGHAAMARVATELSVVMSRVPSASHI